MNILLIIVLYFGFVSLGLPDQILGVAWPDMRQEFGLPLDYAGVLIVTTSICTTVSSFLSGYLLRRFSISSILATSAGLTAVAIIVYGLSPSWLLVILATIPLGLGAGAVDSVLNDYVSKNLTSRHMNFLHGFWGVGATIGPAIMTLGISLSHSWRAGYVVIGALQLILLILFVATRKMWKNAGESQVGKEKVKFNLFKTAPLLSVIFFFVYTALEGAIGVWFYSILVEERGMGKELAGALMVIFWCTFTLGRFANGWLAPKLKCSRVISWSVVCAFAGILLLFIDNTLVTLAALFITGISLSGIYPCMMFETSSRFEPKEASVLTGYQVGFACLGYALLIPLIGLIMERFGLEFFIPSLIVMSLALILLDLSLNKVLKINA